MRQIRTRQARAGLIWAGLVGALAVPMAAAALSPLLAWREPIYILAGFAGILGLGLMLVQPLLISGDLPGLSPRYARRAHRLVGALLVGAVILHVAGLWITSPPDVVDALLFVSPTPFSVWGVVAMWAVFAVAVLALLRKRLRLRTWRRAHTGLAIVIVAGTVIHALQIEGTMETITKFVLCALVVAAAVRVILKMRVWAGR